MHVCCFISVKSWRYFLYKSSPTDSLVACFCQLVPQERLGIWKQGCDWSVGGPRAQTASPKTNARPCWISEILKEETKERQLGGFWKQRVFTKLNETADITLSNDTTRNTVGGCSKANVASYSDWVNSHFSSILISVSVDVSTHWLS